MESKELANIISEYAKELKAFKIKVYDLSNIASYSNYAVIVSTTSLMTILNYLQENFQIILKLHMLSIGQQYMNGKN